MPFDQALRIFGRHPQAINGSRVRARTLRPEILIAINRLSPNRMAVLIHFSPEQHGLLDVKEMHTGRRRLVCSLLRTGF